MTVSYHIFPSQVSFGPDSTKNVPSGAMNSLAFVPSGPEKKERERECSSQAQGLEKATESTSL